ncbi:hypothetical protein PanWU01x14_073800 [Parasponia andersonii]|uniref:Uncharacterized protein n=1 Tax=Parasponia andersonii TaxID=3476 RepID=A0A2P5DDB0_PARAD|nr:hypothetical protein PanWU01x14_073800 [Parasponia andersonii]
MTILASGDENRGQTPEISPKNYVSRVIFEWPDLSNRSSKHDKTSGVLFVGVFSSARGDG